MRVMMLLRVLALIQIVIETKKNARFIEVELIIQKISLVMAHKRIRNQLTNRFKQEVQTNSLLI